MVVTFGCIAFARCSAYVWLCVCVLHFFVYVIIRQHITGLYTGSWCVWLTVSSCCLSVQHGFVVTFQLDCWVVFDNIGSIHKAHMHWGEERGLDLRDFSACTVCNQGGWGWKYAFFAHVLYGWAHILITLR